MERLDVRSHRWFIAIGAFPVLWAALWLTDLLATPAWLHPPLALLIVLVYLSQPLWMWMLARNENSWEAPRAIVRLLPAAVLPAVAAALLVWVWASLSTADLQGAAGALVHAQSWRWAWLALPFAVVLTGLAFALRREERQPLTVAAVLALPVSAPLLWLLVLKPVDAA